MSESLLFNHLAQRNNRSGAVLALVVILLPVMLILAAISINLAYMQLVSTEVQIAADVAAMAGAETLGRTQNTQMAVQAAILQASRNDVGGAAFQLGTSDVRFGQVFPVANGRWRYEANSYATNAVQVDARTGANASHAAIPLFFGNVLSTTQFTPQASARSGIIQADICLCIDRSGSMNWDMSGNFESFPIPNPSLISFTDWGPLHQLYLSPPHPTDSRWARLRSAVDSFFNEVASMGFAPHVSLVTWASDHYIPSPFDETWYAAHLDVPLSNNSVSVQQLAVKNQLDAFGAHRIMGGTNMSAGLDLAVATVTGPNSRPYVNKVVVLFTDGEWNAGRDPMEAAYDARDAGVVVHTVALLATSAAPLMQQIASTTGGLSFEATNQKQLESAFREIAKQIGVTLIE
jgi:Mg-chelatase subunit ChlD